MEKIEKNEEDGIYFVCIPGDTFTYKIWSGKPKARFFPCVTVKIKSDTLPLLELAYAYDFARTFNIDPGEIFKLCGFSD